MFGSGSAFGRVYRASATVRIMWKAFFDVVPVLLVTGPIGVGKTAGPHEADALLIEAGSHHATVELEHHAAAQAFAHPADRQLGPTSGMPTPWHCSRESGEQARIDSLSHRDERYEDPTHSVDHPLEWPMRA
jgi:hypothetical protein